MTDPKDHVISPGSNKQDVMMRQDTGLIEAVRRRAHEIWEEEGRPEGSDLDHWTRAEMEILGQAPPLA